jgi:hypothetical protein
VGVITILIGLICWGMYWILVVLLDQLEMAKKLLIEMQP